MAESSAEVVRTAIGKASLPPKTELDSFRQFRRSSTLATLVSICSPLCSTLATLVSICSRHWECCQWYRTELSARHRLCQNQVHRGMVSSQRLQSAPW